MRVAIFRPPHARCNTAFEIQRAMYRYLDKKYNIDITLFVDDVNNFSDDQLKVIKLKRKALSSWQKLWFRNSLSTQDQLFTYHSLPNVLRNFDLIETSDPTLYYYAYDAYRSAKKYGARLVCGSSVTLPELLWIKKGKAQKVIDYVSKISCCTPMVLKRFEEIGLLPSNSEKVIILGHPFDTNIFRPFPRETDDGLIRILTVGRLSREKGHQFLIEAVSCLVPYYPQLRLSIVGEGNFKENLISLVKELLPEGIVTFNGSIDHKELPALYNQCDIFALCSIGTNSWEEYFGAVIGEAMCCGKPIVATKCGGIPYVVKDGETGFLVKQGDVDDLTKKIKILIEKNHLRKEMGLRARKHILEKYSMEKVAERCNQLWTS